MDKQEKINQAKALLHKLVLEDWKTSDLFSPKWFGTVGFILLSYFICFKLLDKRRFTQILLFGSLLTVSITVVDLFGTQFGRWTYLTRVFPIVPSLFFFDFTIIPLYYMLVYQYSSTWKSFAIWNAILAGIISFAFFPILTALKMFELNNWKYIYFFSIIYAMAFFCRGAVWFILSVQNKRMES
ncbi:CBO0543 family protein [Bacillus sp. 1NLA3E]|uniref:CBO0543 family protein n=1 Tax=Bacillus sp. 1NLA3E TaxID=666686 RepID=UPI000247F3B7|nr:CBO0543 family protein [Bacillus sp. 1NLA3E]AGK54614.1 hypothetical protein B1NLA3E_14340 [Bacillus sp. 1NLA3E]